VPEEITRKQSSRAQQLAVLPWQEIEAKLDAATADNERAKLARVIPGAGEARDKVAAKFDVSHRLVEAGEKILKHGVPELQKAVEEVRG
jgi:hypothetical protein